MSVCYYLACHHCRKFIWIAQDGLSGFGFYSGEPHTMRGLRDFFADHVFKPGHQLEFMSEHLLEGDEYMEYEEIDCPSQGKEVKP